MDIKTKVFQSPLVQENKDVFKAEHPEKIYSPFKAYRRELSLFTAITLPLILAACGGGGGGGAVSPTPDSGSGSSGSSGY